MADAYFYTGVIYNETGDYLSALEYMLKAVGFEKDNTEYWYYIADTYHKAGEYEDAAEAYQKVLSIEPENTDAWLDLTDTYLISAPIEKVLETLKKGILADVFDSFRLYARLFVIEYQHGLIREAADTLLSGLKVDTWNFYNELIQFPAILDNPVVTEIIKAYTKTDELPPF